MKIVLLSLGVWFGACLVILCLFVALATCARRYDRRFDR